MSAIAVVLPLPFGFMMVSCEMVVQSARGFSHLADIQKGSAGKEYIKSDMAGHLLGEHYLPGNSVVLTEVFPLLTTCRHIPREIFYAKSLLKNLMVPL